MACNWLEYDLCMKYDLYECLELIFGWLCSWNCNLHNYADRMSHIERELLGHAEREPVCRPGSAEFCLRWAWPKSHAKREQNSGTWVLSGHALSTTCLPTLSMGGFLARVWGFRPGVERELLSPRWAWDPKPKCGVDPLASRKRDLSVGGDTGHRSCDIVTWIT